MQLVLCLVLLFQVPAAPVPPPAAQQADVSVDPVIRALVERFFVTQERESVEEYLALWSSRVQRPTEAQLTFIFNSGDDTFTNLQFTRVWVEGEQARVRIRVTRVRADARMKRPDGSPWVFTTELPLALGLRREDGEWKIVREGAPADELAGALIEESDAGRRASMLAAEPDLLTGRLVEAISRRADVFAQQQAYQRAQPIYERGVEVARLVKDPKALGHALQNLANSLYFQRQYERALPLYEERLSMEREAGNDEGVASALMGIATVRYTTYDYSAALATYREALVIQETLNDQLLVAPTLISIGNVLYLHGTYDEAIAAYRRAETLNRTFHDLSGAAMALEGLARVYSAQGDYASALAAYAGVLEERRKRNALDGQAVVLHSIGEIHFRLGNLDAARASFDESRVLFVKATDLSGAGRAWQGTALVELVSGRPALGERAYAESITACTTAKDGVCVARAQVGLAYALAAQQKYADAVPWYRRAIAAFTAMAANDPGFREPAARAQIGLAEALTGDARYAESLEASALARQTAVALNTEDVLWRALVAQARAERKVKKAAAALGVAKAAVLSVRRMSATALERPSQVVPRDTATAYATLAVIQAEAGDATGAFETAEEMRVHSLRLWLAANETEIAPGMTADERMEERALNAEVRGLLAKRERIAALPKVVPADIERLDAGIAEAINRRNAARDRLFARLPELRAWRGLMTPATGVDLSLLLPDPGQLLLSFVVDEKDVVVSTAQRHAAGEPTLTVHVVSLERQTIGERIARALDTAPLNDQSEWRKSVGELFALLPASVVAALAASTTVLIIPDDLLWRVPFEALPTPSGVLADRATVSYLPSVTAAMRAPAVHDRETRLPLTIVVAPELPPALVERLQSTAPAWVLRPSEPALAEAARVAAIHQETATEVAGISLSGAAATTSSVRESVAVAAAVHIAAPFRLNSASPLFSPVLLAAEPPRPQDSGTRLAAVTPDESVLDVRDVFNLTSPAAVVTLSDPAALSMRDAAAAIPPVQWGWRAAGVRAMLIRRWGGAEERSGGLLAEFYRQLSQGRTPEHALHAARAVVRAQDGGRAPGHWAGWLLVVSR